MILHSSQFVEFFLGGDVDDPREVWARTDHYAVRVWLKWRLVAAFEVVGVIGVDTEGDVLFGSSISELVVDPARAFVEIRGSVKWDGCANWETNEECMVHVCNPEGLDEQLAALRLAYRVARDLLGESWHERRPV